MNPIEYEKTIKDLYKTLLKMYPGSIDVKHDVILEGNQIDVMWEHEIADVRYKTIVECKRYAKPVDKSVVRKIHDTMQYLKATGIIVTTSKFQSGAIELAKEYKNIHLLKVNFFKRKGATLEMHYVEKKEVAIVFDELMSSQNVIQRLHEMDEISKNSLSIINDNKEHLYNLHEFMELAMSDGHEGRNVVPFENNYISLSEGEYLRIKHVEFVSIYNNILPEYARHLSPIEIKTVAKVTNCITGEEKEIEVDDFWYEEIDFSSE
ncbi:restriction endonuclease [Pantoea ananatis]|uniref:restriction endonuclease n=1 Tax=Pantoea ananas TaxID=553 RepID=UPI00197DEF1B|nr:restriction endonuclease [Pantoea ananatis]MBN6029844.1 restriction endonuclease [Pantoea ananatis]